MSQCSKNPVELVLATTDPRLYDAKQGSWLWKGTLYWAVECLQNRQTSVSDYIVPNIPKDKYLPIETNPTTWNYCNSRGCTSHSNSMHVVFTFNPESTDPDDYLQYVLNIDCNVTHNPQHAIADNDGDNILIAIEEISALTKQSYVELWISRESEQQKLIDDNFLNIFRSTPELVVNEPQVESNWVLWFLIALIVMLIIVSSITGGFFIFKKRLVFD